MAKRVLVVDDEPNIVMSLRFLMEREGFHVEVASTGQDAVAALGGPPADYEWSELDYERRDRLTRIKLEAEAHLRRLMAGELGK